MLQWCSECCGRELILESLFLLLPLLSLDFILILYVLYVLLM